MSALLVWKITWESVTAIVPELVESEPLPVLVMVVSLVSAAVVLESVVGLSISKRMSPV